eukprot:TRINITY_DN10545_c2_g1_i1.p2 TRINITY_DN10545_c2_g1~~TRINITY_DN10545_c2_g1_i1.p2  ORF type:complete len:221 (-),score=24.62 TRINITY_DN10545_c2_g1_i1:610-1272(-)
MNGNGTVKNQMNNMKIHDDDNRSLLEKFMQIQSERAKLYNDLKNSFAKLLLEDSKLNNQNYQQQLQSLATRFNECSTAMKQLQNYNNDNNNKNGNGRQIVSQQLDNIQNLEKQKLHLTLASYSLKQAMKAEQFSWERRPYFQGEKEQQNIQDVIAGFKMLQNAGIDAENQQGFDFVSKQMACKRDVQRGIQVAERKLEQVIEDINELIYSIQETLVDCMQ